MPPPHTHDVLPQWVAPRSFRLYAPDACTGDVPGLSRIAEYAIDDEQHTSAILIEFEARAFHVDAYAAHGIACPAAVRGSVLKRQAEFFFGRLAARWAMQLQGCADVEIASGRHREPIWPGALTGSISHSRHVAAAAIGARASRWGMGIDLEEVLAGESLEAVRRAVIDADESALLRACSVTDDDLGFLSTVAFSAKESFFKAAFAQVGRMFGFQALRLRGLDPRRRHLELEVTADLADGLRKGRVLSAAYASVRPGTVLTWMRP